MRPGAVSIILFDMKILGLAGLALLLVVGSSVQTDQRVQKAEAAADQWLKLVDAGNYEQSWQTACEVFQSKITKEQWAKALQSSREPLGQMLSRKVLKATYTDHLPGAPDGEYVVIQYQTSFEHKKEAVETVTPMLENNAWKVSGYFVR